MKKERKIIIKVIESSKISSRILAEFFAKKYNEKIAKEKV